MPSLEEAINLVGHASKIALDWWQVVGQNLPFDIRWHKISHRKIDLLAVGALQFSPNT